MSHAVTLIPGDGVGPEVVDAARAALEATGADLDWDVRGLGLSALEREGTPLPESTLASIRATGVALKGPVITPSDGGWRNVNVALRTELGLFAGLRPCRRLPGVRSRYGEVDIVVIRENTEGMYTGIEFEMGTSGADELIDFLAERGAARLRRDSGISIKTISEHASERIARFAFAYAHAHGRRAVIAGHKANIMKVTDGQFLSTVRRVAAGFPGIAFEDRIIDALCMRLVQRPEDFDVLVLPNLYGDLVSELCAGLVGGPGVVPAADLGDGIAVFGTLHGAATRLAGSGRADPTGVVLAGALLLRHLGERARAERLERAVADVVAERRSVTDDLAADGVGGVSTSEMTAAVIARLTG